VVLALKNRFDIALMVDRLVTALMPSDSAISSVLAPFASSTQNILVHFGQRRIFALASCEL
jgi:hypothetical protein